MRIFALLDEGCDIICHTEAWARHADQALKRQGQALGALTGEARTYKGLGGAQSIGSRVIPWGNGPGQRTTHCWSGQEQRQCHQRLLHAVVVAGPRDTRVCQICSPWYVLPIRFDVCIQIYNVSGSALRAACINEFPDQREPDREAGSPKS